MTVGTIRDHQHIDSEASNQQLRDMAEKVVCCDEEIIAQNKDTETQEDIKHTLNELRVHQIELIMQNEELIRIQSELQAMKDRYFNLYNLAPVGYMTLSKDGIVSEINLTGAAMLGTNRSTITHRPISKFILKEDQDIYYLHRKQLIETGEPQTFDIRLLRKDGSVFWAHLITNGSLDNRGAQVSHVAVSDISEIKRIQSELILAKEEADGANAAKSQFLSTMTHEIRTPLHSIIGNIQLLGKTVQTEKQREYIRTSIEASNLLMAIINDILDYSKISAGKASLEVVPFNLNQFMVELSDLFQIFIAEKGLILETVMAEDLPDFLLGDSYKLKQVLANLIGNSVKFTQTGKIAVAAKRKSNPAPGKIELEFTVTDTGMGIPPDKTNILFKSFSQLDNSNTRKHGGAGLGLSICKGLIEQMGGKIWVEGTDGDGCSFHFTCTLELADPCENNSSAAVERLEECLADKRLRILVAEDDINSRVLAEEFIKENGWQVTSVESGQEAIDLLEHTRFDLILMDIQLPGMNGYTATTLIRQKNGYKTTPIIATTASALVEDRERCFAAGMNDYLAKPFSEKNLYAVVNKWTKDAP